MERLLALKRLHDSIEREPNPLRDYTAPTVHGGIGRDPEVRWTSRDDALCLLGVYKHGYRAFQEVRDDPELPFSCRRPAAPLPPLLQASASLSGETVGLDVSGHAYSRLDGLPVAAAASNGRPDVPEVHRRTGFLQEKEYRERVKALMDAVGEQERLREERDDATAAWEAEWQREQRGEGGRPAKQPRVEAPRESALLQLWQTCGVGEWDR